jgi:LysR family transcriptional regulator (chromosome initiation inhibitor)
VLPELLARSALADGTVVNLAPGHVLPIQLYWHCWNLESAVLDALTSALTATAKSALEPA